MVESMNVTSTILGKKMENYCWQENNYAAEGELMITITLAEYRALVVSNANKQYEIDKANEGKYKRDEENEMLKKEVEALRRQVYDLQYRYAHCAAEKEV